MNPTLNVVAESTRDCGNGWCFAMRAISSPLRTIVATLTVLPAAASAIVASAVAASNAKTIVFCTDTTYPPMESLVHGKAVGADVDIANALAKLQGATAQARR